MNTTTNTSARPRGRHWIGFAAIALAAVALVAGPPAVADLDTGNGGASAKAAPVDIDDIVAACKVAMAQDRIDRSTLHR
jgi:hypothetical protein